MDRTKEYSFVLSTVPRLHARSRLLELGVFSSSNRAAPIHVDCKSKSASETY